MLQEIEQALTSESLENTWRETLEAWSGEPEVAEQLRRWIEKERDEMLELVRSALDPVDLETSMMVRYIEMRSQWIRHNALSNYQLLRTGEPPIEVMFRGSLITSLIIAIEPFIDQEDLQKATEFLSQPLSSRA
jgi:hypothetical protein